jgi:hypothetical protein
MLSSNIEDECVNVKIEIRIEEKIHGLQSMKNG